MSKSAAMKLTNLVTCQKQATKKAPNLLTVPEIVFFIQKTETTTRPKEIQTSDRQ